MIFSSTSCFPTRQRLIDRLRAYQRQGLMAIELSQGVIVTEDDLIQLEELDGDFLIHNYFPPPTYPFVLNLASKNETLCQRSIKLVLDALTLCKKLNISFYSVHAGFITDPTSFGKTSFVFPMSASVDERLAAFERFKLSLTEILVWAQELDIRVLIENNVCTEDLRGKLLFQTADEILQVFCALPSPYLGLLLDTGHLNVTAHTFGFDRMRFIDQVAPYIQAFHISDNNGIADMGEPVREGSWVMHLLHRPEFNKLPIVVECNFATITDLRQYVDWLKAELEN